MDLMPLFLNCATFEDEPTSVCCCGDDDAITCDEAEATETDARVGRAHAAARVCGEMLSASRARSRWHRNESRLVVMRAWKERSGVVEEEEYSYPVH